MPLVVNTNVSAMTAQRNLATNTNSLNRSLERLSSGFRINRAADDAAGLQISETLRAQIRGLKKASENSQDGINLLQVAEGSLGVIQNNLQRMRELTVQAANDTNGETERDAIELELKALMDDINRIANATKFNGVNLLNSAAPASFFLQVGANDVASIDTINIATALGDSRVSALGLLSGSAGFANTSAVNITSNSVARSFLRDIDNALSTVSASRAMIGSFQNRLEGTISNIAITVENFAGAESRIRNLDVAAESSDMVRNQILQQASVSILAQANQSPGLALSLI